MQRSNIWMFADANVVYVLHRSVLREVRRCDTFVKNGPVSPPREAPPCPSLPFAGEEPPPGSANRPRRVEEDRLPPGRLATYDWETRRCAEYYLYALLFIR